MNLKQTVYFMWLVGGIAGLLCWFVQVWVAEVALWSPMMQAGVTTTLMGALIAGLTVGFADHWTSDGTVPKWVAVGAALGALAGVAAGLLHAVVADALFRHADATVARLGRAVPWAIAGSLIGLVTGLRWASVNPFRMVHAFVGGLVGGVLGGLVGALLPGQDLATAFAYVLTGMGITLGVTLAPMLLSDGVLQFVSSGDPRAQNKYGSPRQEWVIQDGDRMVIGSQGGDVTETMYAQDVQIYIPDAMVGPRHAILFARNRRFYVQLHPENTGPHGQPIEPLQMGEENVTGTRELRDGDEVIIGQTLLRFMTKQKRAMPDEAPAGRWQ